MAQFEHIPDKRQRLVARLNLSLRTGSTEDPLTQDALRDVRLVDFERYVVARHLLAALEDEIGEQSDAWWPAGS